MRKFLAAQVIALVFSAAILGALSVVPHGHGDDLDHSKHQTCPVYQIGLHDSSGDVASSFPVVTLLFLLAYLIAASKDVRIHTLSTSAFLRAPPQVS